MTLLKQVLFSAALMFTVLVGSVQATSLTITLQSDPENPTEPVMGDKMHFHSVITNTGSVPIAGLVGWISLVEVDVGHEQPMDLEDWSAHKAIAGASLAVGNKLETVWPMRLIQHGDYRVVISVTDRNQHNVYTSPTIQFHVTRKPVVESSRILPVALGVPFLILGLMGFRIWRQKRISI